MTSAPLEAAREPVDDDVQGFRLARNSRLNSACRGVTLLELLLALALLAALGTIALPALMRTLGERSFESAAELAVNHLLLARAEAQSTGRPIEVIYRGGDSPRLIAREFDLAAPGFEGEDQDDADDEDASLFAPPVSETQDEQFIPEPWAHRALPGGVRMVNQMPATLRTMDDALAFDLGAEDPEPSTTLRMAVFLPDGSALVADELWLLDDDDRVGRLETDGWTGIPRFTRLDPAPPAGPSPPDSPDPSRDAHATNRDSPATSRGEAQRRRGSTPGRTIPSATDRTTETQP